jgi:indole-3-glycerol phosphate synthase
MNQGENILQTIVRQKKHEISLLPERGWTAPQLKALLDARPDQRDFTAALTCPAKSKIALIAEIKKASPSAGVICPDFDPVRIARTYEAAGASCLSVLTDHQFFQGSLEYLREIRQSVRLPLLRKDFIIDERQIAEAVEWGADAVLLIVSILSDKQLRHFHRLACEAGLAALVEVHDAHELDRAMRAGARLIGVNNRDLKTFQVDLGTTEALAGLIQDQIAAGQILLVAESGIHSRSDVLRLQKAGAKAILVGESLMRQGDIEGKIKELLDQQ